MLQFFFCLSALLWETMKSIRASHLHSEREMGLLSGIFCVAECCGAPFRFTRIFSDVLELDFLHGGNSGRADAFWHAGSVGAGAVFFPRKKNSLPAVHSRDDDAVSGHDVVAVSGVKPSGNAGQTAGSRFARNFCNVFRLYYVPLFPWNIGKCHGGGTYGRGGRIPDFFADRHTAWKSGHPVGTGIFVFGLL